MTQRPFTAHDVLDYKEKYEAEVSIYTGTSGYMLFPSE